MKTLAAVGVSLAPYMIFKKLSIALYIITEQHHTIFGNIRTGMHSWVKYGIFQRTSAGERVNILAMQKLGLIGV